MIRRGVVTVVAAGAMCVAQGSHWAPLAADTVRITAGVSAPWGPVGVMLQRSTESRPVLSGLSITLKGKSLRIPKFDFERIRDPKLAEATITISTALCVVDESGNMFPDPCLPGPLRLVLPFSAVPTVEGEACASGLVVDFWHEGVTSIYIQKCIDDWLSEPEWLFGA